MKRTILRYTSILLTMLLLLPMWTGVFASAAGEPGIVASGYCGKAKQYNGFGYGSFTTEDLEQNLRWTLDAEGTLTVSGTGEMMDFTRVDDYETVRICPVPWNSDSILKVVFEEGVETVGCGAFSGCSRLASVEIPASMKTIKSFSFSGCALKSIALPDSVDMGSWTFGPQVETITVFRGDYEKAGNWRTDWYDFAFWYADTDCRYFGPSGNFTSAVFTEDARYIPSYAFFQNRQLNRVFIPNSITNLGRSQNAFECQITIHDYAYHIYDFDIDVYFSGTKDQWDAKLSFMDGLHNPGYDARYLRNYATVHFVEFTNGHYLESIPETKATDTEHGYTAGVYCVDTDEWVVGHEVIHNTLGEMTLIKEPTETESGECIIVCTVCGESGYYFMDPVTGEPTEDPGHNDPAQQEDNSFFSSIRRMMRTIIDFFLRLFRWLGGKK